MDGQKEGAAERSSAAPSFWPILSGLLAASIWGGMYVVSDVVLEYIPPFTLLLLRLLLGILTWGLILLARRDRVGWRRMGAVLLTGFIGYGVSLGLQFVGTDLSTAANGALITTTTPVFVALFGVWILGERLSRRRLAALGLAAVGVVLVLDPSSADLSSETTLGDLALLGAGLTWGLYSVLVRRDAGRGIELPVMTFVLLFGGLPLAVPLAVSENPGSLAIAWTPALVLGVLYLGIVSTAAAMYLWNYAFAHLPATTAGLAFFAQPVVGVGLSALLLGEQPDTAFLLGGLLIGLGVWIAIREK
jgi:drug/metabolite transporter (DMT)-like permease